MERLVAPEGKVLLVLGAGAVLWLRLWPGLVGCSVRRRTQFLSRLAESRFLAFGCVVVVALGVSAGLSAVRWPVPKVHDEFSYLLAADTFARGRATNPTHPLWRHFEIQHVLQHPTYQSKYPPAQGLALAVGQVLTGQPILGAWLSFAGMCAAIWWMLRAWVPPGWALLGGLLPVVRWGVFGNWEFPLFFYWSQSLWGGAVAAGAGALVFGALRRIYDQPRARDAWILAAGLGVLANSRPYEGLLAALPVAGVLIVWAVKRVRRSGVSPVAPVFGALLGGLTLAAAATGAYNARVTGSPVQLPYWVHEDASAMRHFEWQPFQEERPRLEGAAEGRSVTRIRHRARWKGEVMERVYRFRRAWRFYLGWALTLPLLFAAPRLGRPWMRFAGGTVALVAA
ncbi:MAG: hypothetical protein P1P84_02130 [Deferrisomatales bacterium]|nr:hypothetical protein [Deferrisomatales bacterium]